MSGFIFYIKLFYFKIKKFKLLYKNDKLQYLWIIQIKSTYHGQ